jgi:TonB-linked SusC/RagA family outer membrane protein
LALLCIAGMSAAVAQTRAVTGRVVDAAERPLEGVEVLVTGTNIRTATNADGVFTLSVPAGAVELVVRMIGYRRAVANVPAGVNSVDVITLVQDVLRLEEVVVTGHATGVERRNLANAVATVNAAELAKAPAASVEQMLAGKVAGVDFRENSGAPGGGSRVRLRGMTSIIGSGEPLYVIDGVIVSDQKLDPGMNAISLAAGRSSISSTSQMNPINRVADLNPNDIESVEILKGASAAAIYGSRASNGVIIIQTKRGTAGAPRFQIRQAFGIAMRSFSYNGGRVFQTLEDAVDAFGPQAADYWSPGYEVYNLEDQLSGRKPLQVETSASMSGGTENTRYYVSGLVRHEPGIVVLTEANKASLRLNLDQDIGDKFTISTGVEVMHTNADRGMFGNDNAGTSYYFVLPHHPNFYDLRPTCEDGVKRVVCDDPTTASYPENPFVASNPLQSAALMDRSEKVFRMIGTGRLDWEPVTTASHQLRFGMNGGFDEFTQNGDIISPPELQFEDDDGLPGSRVLSYAASLNTNINLNAVHQYTTSLLTATTSVGAQYEYRKLNLSRNAARGLIAGTANLSSGVSQLIEEVNEEEKDFGLFVQEEVLIRERLLLTAGLRADRSSNNALTDEFYYYPKGAVSYRLPMGGGLLSELKLRAAYGQTGNRPIFGQKFSTMYTTNVTGVGGTLISTAAGNVNAKPERQEEIEGGVDAQMFDGRFLVELTGYRKSVTDLLLRRDLPASTGFASEIFNGGKLRVNGVEAIISGTLLQRRSTLWTMGLNFAMNRSKIVELPVPPFRAGGSFSQGAIYIEQDSSATQWVAYDTVPGTGMTDNPETFVSTQADAEPRWTGGMTSTFGYKALTFSTTIDAQKGGMINLGTWRHWDGQANAFDHDEIDPVTGEKLGVLRRRFQRTVPRTYTRDASYIRMRELRVAVELPPNITEKLWDGIRSASVSLSGRDLFTDQKLLGGDFYPGNDPAVANYNSGSQSANNVQWTREFAAYPSSRSFWLQIDLNF